MDEVIQFYEDNNYPIRKVLAIGRRRGITQAQIYAGMTSVYERVMAGEPIKKINYARLAFSVAEHLDSEHYVHVARQVVRRSEKWFHDVDARLAKLERTSFGYRWHKFWENFWIGSWSEVYYL